MKRILHSGALVLLAALICAPMTVVAQSNQPASAFFGTFAGTGVAKNRDSIYFAVTVRDLDVRIGPAQGGGFQITWTTVIRRGGDPARPDVRRKSTTKTLVPSGAAGNYRCTDSGDPLRGKHLCWARIRGYTLSLFLLAIDDKGTYELQQYDRTLLGTGMKLTFRRLRDGDEVRVVTGRLAKTGN
jgi:hypothetical protein